MAIFGRSDDLQGAEFHDINLRGARFVGADLSGAVLRGVEIANAEIDSPWLDEGGAFLRVNGVDVVPLVEAELNRRFPGREQRTAGTRRACARPTPGSRRPGRPRSTGSRRCRPRWSTYPSTVSASRCGAPVAGCPPAPLRWWCRSGDRFARCAGTRTSPAPGRLAGHLHPDRRAAAAARRPVAAVDPRRLAQVAGGALQRPLLVDVEHLLARRTIRARSGTSPTGSAGGCRRRSRARRRTCCRCRRGCAGRAGPRRPGGRARRAAGAGLVLVPVGAEQVGAEVADDGRPRRRSASSSTMPREKPTACRVGGGEDDAGLVGRAAASARRRS